LTSIEQVSDTYNQEDLGPFGLFDIYKQNDFIDSAELKFDEKTKLELQIEGFEGIY
jgi:hypothetical protein